MVAKSTAPGRRTLPLVVAVLSAVLAVSWRLAPQSAGALGTPDDQDSWRRLKGQTVDARYTGRDSLRAARAQDVLEGLEPLPGLVKQEGMRVLLTIAPTAAVMDSLVAGRLPEWVGAVALPGRMEIVVPGRSTQPRSTQEEVRILRHEWAHLALAHHLDGLRAPRWFDEGLAEWYGGGWLERGGWRLGIALLKGDAPALDSISLTWPRTRQPAEIAYMLSASVVQYLWEASGREGLEAFFAEWKARGSFGVALRRVYGATEAQLESDWRKWVRKRYGWLVVLSDSVVFWAVLSVALASMVLVRRRHRREQMARLRAGEPPDAPAYWTAEEER